MANSKAVRPSLNSVQPNSKHNYIMKTAAALTSLSLGVPSTIINSSLALFRVLVTPLAVVTSSAY